MWLSSFLVSIACLGPGSLSDADPLVKGIGAAAAANRASFSSGSIRFQYGIGKASNAEAARKGDLARITLTEGSFALDGKMALYECVFSVEDMVARRTRIEERTTSSPISSCRFLTDGNVTLWDQIDVDRDDKTAFHTSQISAGTKDFYAQLSIPLGLGNPDPNRGNVDKLIEMAAEGEDGWALISVVDDAKFDGHDVAILTFQSPREKMQFWIDVERGAVPLKLVWTRLCCETST